MNTEGLVVGPVVVLSGPWLDVVADALAFKAARLWRDTGMRPTRAHEHLETVVRQLTSAMSADDVRADSIGTPSTDDEYCTTSELATLLRCSERHARRVADRLDARFAGRRKLIPLQAVRQHLEGKNDGTQVLNAR
jgi:hypothetical protein